MATLNFDATNVDITNHYEAIPAGDYEAMVTDSVMKSTKDGTGQYLELTLEIQSGQFQGRRLWDRLNLHNRNVKAVEIAQRQLGQLAHATGILQVAESTQLHNRPIIAKVSVRQEPGRDPSNEVKGYKAISGGGVAPAFQAPRAGMPFQQAAAPAPAAAMQSAAAPLPWAKVA